MTTLAPPATMTILHLAYSNAAGVPGRWAAAHRDAGIRAELFIEVPDEYAYGAPATVERWSLEWEREPLEDAEPTETAADRARQLIESADVVMVYDSPWHLEVALEFDKPVLFRAYGSHSRREPERVRQALTSPLVKRATAGTADLAIALGLPLVGAPFPRLEPATMERDVATHSPSNRALKGTDAIVEIAREAGWEVDVVDGVSHADVLERKRTSSLVIDQFGSPPHPDGLGVSATEAMAMGLPVIGRASGEVQRMYAEVGCPAVFVSTEIGLLRQLERLRDPDERHRRGEAGIAYVREFHSASACARDDLIALGL